MKKKRIIVAAIMGALAFVSVLSADLKHFWGERAKGIIDNIKDADNDYLYLTLDLCGSGGPSSEINRPMIDYLRENKIPATFFINGRFIDANPNVLAELAADPLFRVENHGLRHKPASVNGKSVYGIKGTKSEDELIEEVLGNADKMQRVTGVRPKWFRAGTAYYDCQSIEIITKRLGIKIAGFAITLDEGASLPSDKVFKKALAAKPGDILMAHANHPQSGTLGGLKHGLSQLIARGYKFRQLPD